jgi:putative membrane protein
MEVSPMNRRLAPALAALAMLAGPVAATAAARGAAPDPADFVRDYSHDNLTQIALAHMALERSSSPDVRRFAQQVIADRTASQQDVQTLARQTGAAVPQDLTVADLTTIDRLARMDGRSFDINYMDQMVADNESDYRALDAMAKAGPGGVAQVAQAALPGTRAQLDQAQQVDIDVGGTLEQSFEFD